MAIATPDLQIVTRARNGGGFTTAPPPSALISLTGTGFGERPSNKAFFWQPFTTPRAATGNGDMTSHGYTTQNLFGTNAYNSALLVNTAAGRGPDKGALQYNMSFTAGGSEDRDFFPHVAVDTSNTGRGALNSEQIYFAFWMKLVHVSGTPNSGPIQIKGPRSGWAANGSTDYYFSPWRLSPSFWLNGDGSWAYLFQEAVRTDGTDDASEGNNWNAPPWNTGGWNFCEGWMKVNDIGTANGCFLQRINGYDMSVGYEHSGNCRAIAFRDASEFSKLIRFNFLNPGVDFSQILSGSCTYQTFFAEHFIDTTPQRVVLTDTASYTSASKFAVQPEYESWANDLVELDAAKMNFTGFTSGATAYLQAYGPNNTIAKTQQIIVP